MIWNTRASWGWPARTFHWVIAAMILFQFGLGLWMDDGPARADEAYFASMHASIGISILAVFILRLAWRAMNVAPPPPPGMPGWQIKAASIVHWSLYIVTFAAVLAGWLTVSSASQPVPIWLFGFVDMPYLVAAGAPLHDVAEEVHGSLVFTLMALVILHIGAALYHHWLLRDDVLRRMTSGAANQHP
jgi:cytochrome b561